MEELPADEWNKETYVFNEETLQLSSWARSEWARKYAPIPALKGVRTTTQNAKLVLSTIADYSNPTYCGSWPGIDTIMEETGLKRRAIQYALRALEAAGLIEEAPRLAEACPKYLAIPADKRPVFYHVYFVFDSRYITPAFTEWADSRLGELREKYAKQRRAGCNEEPSGVQRVAYKTSTKQLSKTNIDPNRDTCEAEKTDATIEDPSAALDALSTDPDRLRFEQLADTNPELRRLRDEFNFLKRGQTGNTEPSQWTQRFTG